MVEIAEISRRFGELQAVDGLSFTVPGGSIVGFVGANGAGKTTTMRVLMGVLAADSGEVRWRGRPVTAADRRAFGYMPEERGLYPQQGIAAQLVHLGRLHGLSRGAARARATALLDRFGLADRVEEKLGTLSLGNQQRVQIAAALVHDPALLVLDEPFSGLDPDAVEEMSALLRQQADAGVGIVFSSHQLDLVERLSDDLVVVSRGTVVAQGSPGALRRSGGIHHRLRTEDEPVWLEELPWVDVVRRGPLADPSLGAGHEALLTLADPADADRLLRAALERGRVRELAEVVPSVHDVFREVAA